MYSLTDHQHVFGEVGSTRNVTQNLKLGECVCDETINAAMRMILHVYDEKQNFNPCKSTNAITCSDSSAFKDDKTKYSIQIVHIAERHHWVCVVYDPGQKMVLVIDSWNSTYDKYVSGDTKTEFVEMNSMKLCVYRHKYICKDLKKYLVDFYPNATTYQTCFTQQQNDGTSCGLFSIAAMQAFVCGCSEFFTDDLPVREISLERTNDLYERVKFFCTWKMHLGDMYKNLLF